MLIYHILSIPPVMVIRCRGRAYEERERRRLRRSVGAKPLFAAEIRDLLREKHRITARVVRFPSQRVFERQSWDYKADVVQCRVGIPRVLIRTCTAIGWERYAHDADSMSTYRNLLPGPAAHDCLGHNWDVTADQLQEIVRNVWKNKGLESFRGEFRVWNTTSHT